ncbi:cysteine-rich KTR domain-containing protein [Christensenella hongkongensis]|uniref:cysteine-rich KTR domain-containing protein n=1 Tax=Christensenella hongkongensis TaxID=270498 RepID=UPI002672B567|nr:cysteine-rich KTR domain-containing protein [Christensenella hongkongensis]
MNEGTWVLCPICESKTRIKARYDTVLERFPLFCPKCRRSVLINLKNLKTTVIQEPDA